MGLGNSNARANPVLVIKEITDTYLRQNFQSLSDYFSKENQFLGFKFFDLNFTDAVANTKVKHGLTTIPEDAVVTKIVGTGSVTFNFGLFDAENMDLTVTGPCRIRFYIGSYWNPETSQTQAVTDATTYSPAPGVAGALAQVSVPPANNSNQITQYTIQSSEDVVYSNPGAGGITLTLPLASTVKNKLITVQGVSTSNYFTTVRTNPLDTHAYIDRPSTVSTSIKLFRSQLQLVSNGTFYRTVTTSPTYPTMTRLTVGTAATYTLPIGCKWIRIRAVGGGAGGSGVAAAGVGVNNGGTGGTTTFGTATTVLISCTGGLGGGTGAGGLGGTATVTTPAYGFVQRGGAGQSTSYMSFTMGGAGGVSPFGGNGPSGFPNNNGVAALANSGSGGGGGSWNGGAGYGGPGGGAGAYAEAIIINPDASYTYTIGAAGVAGVAGGGNAMGGGLGGTGMIIIEEYYQ